jgi:hypothetical protein
MTSFSHRDTGIPVFMVGRSAENGKEILPALAPEFDSKRDSKTLPSIALPTYNP